ncbi:MAG: hypothetical protein CVV27_04245 [Candidatus Melainabacteria bacterium HGW-Melainabacteria-1]|nr:MAG: hypothetical protein CVV27_04245 [Candidatus Melainabacteria bacterium HGW-Melainabacteria-1]
MKFQPILLPLLLLTACQAPLTRSMNPAPLQGQLAAQRAAASRGLIKSEFSYSADKTELTLTMTHDTGEVVKARTVRNPLSGNSVQAETIIERNGSVVQRRASTPAEAELAVKVAANNGWQDVFRDLKARYQLAGLIS